MTNNLGYLVPEFPRQTHIFFWRECEALRALGLQPIFLSTRRPPLGDCPHPFRDQAAAATHYVFPPRPTALITLLRHPWGTLRTLARWLRLRGSLKTRAKYLGLVLCAAELVRYCRRHGVRHIHVHSCADAALLALFAQHLGGLTYSLTLHNPLGGHGPFQRDKWGHAAFGIVVANVFLDDVRRELGTQLPPVYVAPMGTDMRQFVRSAPYEPWRGTGPLRLFACGRLNPCKGHDLLIEAVQHLVTRGIEAHLAIAGDDQDSGTGQFRRDLEATIQRCGMQTRVTLLGAQTEAAVRDQLMHAHLFVLASRMGEAMPVVLIEALAMGVPAVATDVGGTKELIRDGTTGLLVPPGSVPALADAMHRLATQPELALRCSAAGRELVAADYASDRSARTIAAALPRVAAGFVR